MIVGSVRGFVVARAIAILLAFASLAIDRTAHAQAPSGSTIAIEYVAPGNCPDEISVRAGVIARLGRDPFFGDSERRAFIDVKQTAAGYVAVIELRESGRGASRRAIGPTTKCEDAVNALELALAVIVDPSYGSTTPAPPPANPQPFVRPAPYPQPRATYEPPGWRGLPPPTRAPPAPPKHELALALGGLTSQHPKVATAFMLRAGYLLPGWRIGVLARLSSSSGNRIEDLTIRVSQTEILAEGCRLQGFFVFCAAIGVGSKDVSIADYTYDPMAMDRGADYSEAFFETAFSAGVHIPLGRAFLRPTVDLALPLPAVKIESLGVERYRVGFGQVGFDLALGFRW